ncbi:MAG: 4-alpha-glucanotransferase [Sporichthyaceae bacterium]
MTNEALRHLARLHGVATDYRDWRGEPVEVAEATVVAVLAAVGVDASGREAVAAALVEHHRRYWRRMLPPFLAVRQFAGPGQVWVHVPHGAQVEVTVELEDGGRLALAQVDRWVEPAQIDGELIGEATFALPENLPLGWHHVHAMTDECRAHTPLVVSPRCLELPAPLAENSTWGYLAQLYQVRSSTSWGIGDLRDLATLVSWSATDQGAGFALINPMHAPSPVVPIEPSPYLPMTRRFSDPLYLRVEDVPEFARLGPQSKAAVADLRASVSMAIGPADLLDRDAAWTAKRAALELIHAAGRTAEREAQFAAFVEREGAGLADFATWCALVERRGQDWRKWPVPLHDPHGPAVERARADLADRVGFYAWLQWQLEDQRAVVAEVAQVAGMGIGVIGDLAVGVHPHGADAWALADCLAGEVSVGAPPDSYNQQGQDWNQPPWLPAALAERGYAPYRDMVRAVLRHSGGVRVDHVMGLFRLWWIPAGSAPALGTYVHYDHDALLGILALEAHRVGAVVIGEDLGTVEPSVRSTLAERGILGTSILWFERDGAPRPPESWRRLCLATVTTHDLPPSAGYLDGGHIRLREALCLLVRTPEQEWADLAAELDAWRRELTARGLDPGDPGENEPFIAALHAFLAQTPSVLHGVALADAVGEQRSINQPGTSREYPNWQLPLLDAAGRPVLLEDVMSMALPTRLTSVFATLER